ncbi:metal-dependent transcriptional regulator [Alkaliphilus crotonatoxidans]
MNLKKRNQLMKTYEVKREQRGALTASMEDYLETIYLTQRKEGHVRMNILAEKLRVQVPSATKMVQKLTRQGLLDYEKYGLIHLTEEGEALGRFLWERHQTVEAFLTLLEVEDNLYRNIEAMEHSFSMEILHQIRLLNDFFRESPQVMEQFRQFKRRNEDKKTPDQG